MLVILETLIPVAGDQGSLCPPFSLGRSAVNASGSGTLARGAFPPRCAGYEHIPINVTDPPKKSTQRAWEGSSLERRVKVVKVLICSVGESKT